MTPQEKDLITTLLTRLKSAGGQPKDPEAEALIRQAMSEQPDAPYYLTQTVLIQDLSLHSALLFQGIESLVGNHYAGGLTGAGMTPGLGETVVNNY